MRQIIEGFGSLPDNYDNLEEVINVVLNSCEKIEDGINDGDIEDEDDRYKFVEQALLRVANYLTKINK